MTPSPVRRIVLRTGKACLKVLRSLASSQRLPRTHQRVLPSMQLTSPPRKASPASKAAGKVAAHAWLDDVTDLEDLQNRLNEAAERKVCV